MSDRKRQQRARRQTSVDPVQALITLLPPGLTMPVNIPGLTFHGQPVLAMRTGPAEDPDLIEIQTAAGWADVGGGEGLSFPTCLV